MIIQTKGEQVSEIFLNLIEEEFPELEEQKLRGLCELFENALADRFASLNEDYP
jgi:shikimate kinase